MRPRPRDGDLFHLLLWNPDTPGIAPRPLLLEEGIFANQFASDGRLYLRGGEHHLSLLDLESGIRSELTFEGPGAENASASRAMHLWHFQADLHQLAGDELLRLDLWNDRASERSVHFARRKGDRLLVSDATLADVAWVIGSLDSQRVVAVCDSPERLVLLRLDSNEVVELFPNPNAAAR